MAAIRTSNGPLVGAGPRIVVTGISVWCSVARGRAEFADALANGVSGLRTIPASRQQGAGNAQLRTDHAFALPDDVFAWLRTCEAGPIATFARFLAEDALRDAHVNVSRDVDATDIGLSLATTVGGSFAFIDYLAECDDPRPRSPHTSPLLSGPSTAGAIAGYVAAAVRCLGPLTTISTACASGVNSIGRACDLIRYGHARMMLAGGYDIFSELTFTGFNALQALARDKCRPFDEARDGMSLGDGGAMLLLESEESASARGVPVYGVVSGYGIANEAHHPTGPDPTGRSAAGVMRAALADAGRGEGEVDFINTHGTGTVANDDMEVRAIHELLGGRARDVPITATKGAIGHTLGGAGSLEVAATILSLQGGFLPHVLGVTAESTKWTGLNVVVNQPARSEYRVALSNSFGFGGNIASVVLESP